MKILRRLIPILWLLALAVAVTWPAALLPDLLLGHPRCSAGCHAWVLWASGHHLLPDRTVLSPLLFFPHGGDVLRLYGSDVLSPLLLAPLSRILEPGSLYNGWVLAMVWANGLALYALARDRALPVGPALVAASVFQAAPFFQHELLNGTSELVAAAALPLFTLYWMRLMERPTLRRGLAVGLVFGVGGLASVYTPFFLLLIAAVTLAWRMVTSWQVVFSGTFLRASLAALLPVVALLAPLAAAHWRHGAGAVHARRVDWDPNRVPLPDSAADLLGFVDPRLVELPVQVLQGDGSVYQYWTLGSVFLGFCALGLAAWGWWRTKGSRGPWVALLVAALLVALGPYLSWGGQVLQVGGSPIPLPSLPIRALFPPFALTALHTYRYTAVVVMALAMLAGAGAQALPRPWMAPLAAILVISEALLGSPSGWPLPTTPLANSVVWDALARQPTGGTILLPFSANTLGDLSWGLLAQTRHGQPWSDGGIHFRSEERSLQTYADVPLLAWLADEDRTDLPPEGISEQGFRDLFNAGFRYLVLDIHRLPHPEEGGRRGKADPRQVRAWLEHHLGAPLMDDARLFLFTLPPSPME